jgi:Right handed beta helix region
MKRFNTRLFSRLLPVVGAVTLAATVLATGASAAAPPGPYANGFETAEDVGSTDQAMFNVERVDTGTNGITSASGDWHAVAAVGSGAFTRYGGYSPSFPAGGYTTSADIYLDTADSPLGADLRFDWSSAINGRDGLHKRDFIFHVGTDGNRGFVVSASNNSPGWPANPDRHPYSITQSGWYRFQHQFSNVGGVLVADLTVRPRGAATPLATWTLSNLSDTIGDTGTVGGNRYGWLVYNQLPLALDNVTRSGVVAPAPTCTTVATSQGSMTAAVVNPGNDYAGPLPLSGCQIGVYFDEDGSVKNADIAGATHYGVFADKGAKVDVTGSEIHQIGNSPFNGAQNGRAVFYANGATGTVSGNHIYAYQKNGVHATGAATAVQVLNNTVTGRGQLDTIAQNGVVIVSGATALIEGNVVSGHSYLPADTEAPGSSSSTPPV